MWRSAVQLCAGLPSPVITGTLTKLVSPGRAEDNGSLLVQAPIVANRLSDAKGGLAQLARAPALQAGGQRFESVILHLGYGQTCKQKFDGVVQENPDDL